MCIRDRFDEHGTLGVLQVLDKRSSPTFSLRDMELLGVFAGQATVAIAAAKVQRDTARLLASVLAEIGPELEAEQVDALVASATANLDTDDEAPFWRMVDQIARMRGMSDREMSLVADILEVVAGHAERTQRGRIGQ